MDLSTLKPAEGSIKKGFRIGRGQGSGKGGTSARGHKGAKSRSGYKSKRNHEGGQMPLQMRLPKRGFTNPNRKVYIPLNLDYLQDLAVKYNVSEISVDFLKEKGIIKRNDLVKVLGNGELSSALKISANAASTSAVTAVEAKGGAITIV